MNTFPHLTIAAAAISCLAVPASATAASVALVFTAAVDFGVAPQAPTGSQFQGSLTWDDSTGSTDARFPGETWYTVTAFQFDFAGTLFGLGDLLEAKVVFDGGGFAGLQAVAPGLAFVPGPGTAFLAFDIGARSGTASLSFQPGPASVPAPPSALLAASALLGLAAIRRRNRAAVADRSATGSGLR